MAGKPDVQFDAPGADGTVMQKRERDLGTGEQTPELSSRFHRSEGAYIMTMMVLLMPILMAFLALAVDATYYWFRGVELQRAADSSALAGVTRMPKYNEAVSSAYEIAKRNGLVDGEDNIRIVPERIPKNNKRFKVTINDDNVGIFFGRVLSDGWKISKTSTAEYISNIPLGSKENAIGTGYLEYDADKVSGSTVQNFWLAIGGPCAPKEAGDQLSSRWDGNAVNASKYSGGTAADNDQKYSMLCDVDPSGADTGVGYLKRQRDLKVNGSLTAPVGAPYPNLYPAMVENRDYAIGKTGYDYIVDVPCASVAGVTPPPPCDGTGQGLPGDLVIQVFDPVFDPDSIQRWGQKVIRDVVASPVTNEFDDRVKPDKYGFAYRPDDMKGCVSNPSGFTGYDYVTHCKAATFGANNPVPWDVRVNTDIRLYKPDSTPLDYTDDVLIPMTEFSNRAVPDNKFVFDGTTGGPNETNSVRRFGSCLKWTDEWTASQPDPSFPTDPTKIIFRSLPQQSGTDFVPSAAPSGFTADVTNYITTGPPGQMSTVDCDKYSMKWSTIKRIRVTDVGMKRGRYRLNIRTVDAENSFGQNGFGIRAFFIPTTTPLTDPPPYPLACFKTMVGTCDIAEQPSVAGDSTMSVFASVNRIASFYLAQLSPAKLFRGKTVVVSLWDPGEGADALRVLRPQPSGDTGCATADSDPVYCVQDFVWTVGRPNIATYDSTHPDVGLSASAADYNDVCADKGEPQGAASNPIVLPVSGGVDSVVGCTTAQPAALVDSRAGYGDATKGKFNDRLVTLAIKVPDTYGCWFNTTTNKQTGAVDPATGNVIPCDDLDDKGAGYHVPEYGWWKIKYYPTPDGSGGYKKITDRTTWSVGLRGDPVHLVPSS